MECFLRRGQERDEGYGRLLNFRALVISPDGLTKLYYTPSVSLLRGRNGFDGVAAVSRSMSGVGM